MSDVDRIKERLDIVTLVEAYVELRKAGSNYHSRCPFHNEKNPSFFVSPERQTFKCFGCGVGGDIFTFIQKIEGMEFPQALSFLAERAGVTLESTGSSTIEKKKEKDVYQHIFDTAVVFWQRQLGKNPEAITYLKERGFNKDMVMRYKIGFAPSGWTGTLDFLTQRGFTLEDIEQIGLIKEGRNPGNYYDRFRGRVMFPLFNIQGNVVAASGRIFGADAQDGQTAKYLNSPETVLFNKSKELYGFNFAKQAIRKNNFALLVEGQFDLVLSQQIFPNTVATSGTSLSDGHLKQLRRFCDRLVFVYDTDQAGLDAAYRGAKMALTHDFEVRIARLEEGKDPADVIVADAEMYREAITNARDIFDFYLAHIQRNYPEGRERTQVIEDRLLSLVVSISNPLEQDRYIKKLSGELSISEPLLFERVSELSSKIRANQNQSEITNQQESYDSTSDPVNPYLVLLRHCAGLFLWQRLSSEPPFGPTYLESEFSKEQKQDIEAFISPLSDKEKDSVVFELENSYKNTIITQNIIQELAERLARIKSNMTLQTLQKSLKQAELGGDTKLIEQSKKEIARILSNS